MPVHTELSRQLRAPAYKDLGADQNLQPIFPGGVEPNLGNWEKQRQVLRKQWDEVIGKPSFGDFDRTPQIIRTFEQAEYRGTIFRQPTAPGTRQLLLLMEPKNSPFSPRPGAIVPFYHPDDMAGYDLQNGKPIVKPTSTRFGWHLVQQGYVVLCTEAFPYNTVPEPKKNEGFAWWHAAADKLLRDNPDWTGIGKLVWDTSRAVDLLLSRPGIDEDRIVIMGHSLGGKMAFYTGALDERIKAIISSDFGIGFAFTNWDAPWYLDNQIHDPNFPLAHHQLLALHAPRSFLLIGGEADRPASWQYINAAKEVYKLYGKEDALGFFDHGAGHDPTPESLVKAYGWLAEQFGLPVQPWQM